MAPSNAARLILGFITHPPSPAAYGFLESRSPHRPRRTPTVFVVRPAFTMRASDRSIHIRLIFRTIRKLISAKASLLTINLVDSWRALCYSRHASWLGDPHEGRLLWKGLLLSRSSRSSLSFCTSARR